MVENWNAALQYADIRTEQARLDIQETYENMRLLLEAHAAEEVDLGRYAGGLDRCIYKMGALLGVDENQRARTYHDDGCRISDGKTYVTHETRGNLAQFNSPAEAEAYIVELSKTDPEGVNRGDYGIDVPEGMMEDGHNLQEGCEYAE